MLSRSYLIDIALVGFACFTLVCVLAQTPWQESSRQTFAVEIRQADGRTASYRVNRTNRTADQLREDLVKRLSVQRTPNVAWMQWYQETAERYAAACAESAAGLKTRQAHQQSDTESVFRTVSTGAPTTGPPSNSGDEAAGDQLARWQDFWTERQVKAATWLASYEKNAQSRGTALNASIQITPVQSWLPSASVGAKAALIAVLVVLLGSVWRLLCPPRSCHLGSVAPVGSAATAMGEHVAAMCFRESWVRVRQPAGVVLRSVCGWTIVLASLVAGVSVMIQLLVS